MIDTIARLTPILAGLTVGTTEHTLNARLLRAASRRLEDLSLPQAAADPVAAFLKAVDVRQVAVQVPVLEEAIAEVEAHLATLPA